MPVVGVASSANGIIFYYRLVNSSVRRSHGDTGQPIQWNRWHSVSESVVCTITRLELFIYSFFMSVSWKLSIVAFVMGCFCLTAFVSRSMNCPSTNSKQICNHKILSYFEKYEVNRSFE